MLGEEDDIAAIKSSDRGGGSNGCGSRFVKPEETGTSEEIGRLDLMLSRISNNCFWVCAKSRVAIDFETDGTT